MSTSTAPAIVQPPPCDRTADRTAAAILLRRAAAIEDTAGDPGRVRIYRRAARFLVQRAGGVIDAARTEGRDG